MKTKLRILLAVLSLLSLMICTACGKPTLHELLNNDSTALDVLYRSRGSDDAVIKCKDYTIYYEGGIDDSINATRYSSGLKETFDRFVEYHYIVIDNETGWKYIFEDPRDIATWISQKSS